MHQDATTTTTCMIPVRLSHSPASKTLRADIHLDIVQLLFIVPRGFIYILYILSCFWCYHMCYEFITCNYGLKMIWQVGMHYPYITLSREERFSKLCATILGRSQVMPAAPDETDAKMLNNRDSRPIYVRLYDSDGGVFVMPCRLRHPEPLKKADGRYRW